MSQTDEKELQTKETDGALGAAGEKGLLIDELARLPERTLLDEKRLAAALGVVPRTLRRMVGRFELPPPVPLAGRSVWFAGRVLAYIEATADRVEREAERRARKISQLSP